MLHVYTFKEGLLSRLAHDLRLSVPRFEVGLSAGRVDAWFDPASARVDGVATGDRVDPDALSPRDKATIEATVRDEVLGVERVRFEGRVDGAPPIGVAGRLILHPHVGGKPGPEMRVEMRVPVRLAGDQLHVETVIQPSAFGVRPYRAMGGALRLADRWRVVLRLPWPGGSLAEVDHRWTGLL